MLAAALVVGAAAGCTDENVVYKQGVPFSAPATAANGFLGYGRESDKQTICGNCHVDQQGRWAGTGHATAWQTLQASGSAQAFCQGCHTVNERGNAVKDSAGFNATLDPRYHDVQCESCHGPGLDHVSNPSLANRPLASIVADPNQPGCGECHNGTHHPFVEEWKQSKHAFVEPAPSTNAQCVGCHTGQGALAAMNVNTNYVEKNSATPQPIVCAVCHDPHSVANPKQLRYRIDTPDEEQNLCIKCHHKRSQPDIDPVTKSSRGPHSPEGPLLLGENVGFWFNNTPYNGQQIVGTHGTSANPRLCAGCHVTRFAVTDSLTKSITFQVTGHRFEAIPCVDASGKPTANQTCDVSVRTFRACTNSGCHGSEAAARSAFTAATARINLLASQLKGLVDQVRATEIKDADGRWTSAEGADFNYQLALKPGSVVHNPFLIEALLTASIQEMQRTYNLKTQVPLDLRNLLSQPHAMGAQR